MACSGAVLVAGVSSSLCEADLSNTLGPAVGVNSSESINQYQHGSRSTPTPGIACTLEPSHGAAATVADSEASTSTLPRSDQAAEDPADDLKADWHVVSGVRTIAGDSVFTSWLGYPKSRNCWRSFTTHFAPTIASSSLTKTRVRLSVDVVDGEPTQPALEGRVPPAREIRASAKPSSAAASDRRPPHPQQSKKARKREYETKVHTIRIDQSGIHEFRGVKRAGDTVRKDEKPLPHAVPGTDDACMSADTVPVHRDANIDAPMTVLSEEINAKEHGAAAGEGARPHGSLRGDERSELWAAHRQLNEAAWRMPKGVLFRIDVTDFAESQVTVRWVYPGSSPSDNSAWIGLWDANAFDWTVGEPRPRYIRYKVLTSSRQEGTMRFTAKEWTSLADGEYLFSIDTGSLPVGAADSTSYCVSQRLKIVNEAVVSLVGCSHGSPLPPAANQIALSRAARLGCPEAARSGVANVQESDSESDSESDEAQQYLFAVPLIEYEGCDESQEVKRVYAMVDRLSYLDWGLRSEDEVSGKRVSRLASHSSDDFGGCIVHDGAIWGEAAHGRGNSEGPGAKTARTSEGYGEATCATAERLIRILARLTCFVPAMGGWDGVWNLDSDATFLDVGSGYGKVVIHAKLLTECRSAVGVECVAKRVEISTLALQGLYSELDRDRLANDLLKGVAFEAVDATTMQEFNYSHIYIFDRVFSEVTLAALGKVLQRSPFYVMVSSRAPKVWWGVGVTKVQPVAKMRFVTTGRERCTVYIYINSHFIPGVVKL